MVQFADALVIAIFATSTIAPVLALPAPAAESENALEARAKRGVRMPSGKKVGAAKKPAAAKPAAPKPKKASAPAAPAAPKMSLGRKFSKAGHIANGVVAAAGVGTAIAAVVHSYKNNKKREDFDFELDARDFDDEIEFDLREFDDLDERSLRTLKKIGSLIKKVGRGASKALGHAQTASDVAYNVKSMRQPREYEDEIEMIARELDDEFAQLDARALKRIGAFLSRNDRKLSKAGHIFNGAVATAGVGTAIAAVVNSYRNNKKREDFDFGMDAREYDDELEYDLREFDDELNERGLRSLKKIGSLIKKVGHGASRALGHAQTATDVAATVHSMRQPRDFDDELEFEARDFDELDERSLRSLKKIGSIIKKVGHGASRALGHAQTATDVAATVHSMRQPREFDDELEFDLRDFDELDERSLRSLKRIGSIIKKVGRGASKALGHAQTATDVAATVHGMRQPREYDEFELEAREYYYDELD